MMSWMLTEPSILIWAISASFSLISFWWLDSNPVLCCLKQLHSQLCHIHCPNPLILRCTHIPCNLASLRYFVFNFNKLDFNFNKIDHCILTSTAQNVALTSVYLNETSSTYRFTGVVWVPVTTPLSSVAKCWNVLIICNEFGVSHCYDVG